MKTYSARFGDVNCGHAHRTFEAAERCAAATLRAAKAAAAGKRSPFGHPLDSSLLATFDSSEPAVFVKIHN